MYAGGKTYAFKDAGETKESKVFHHDGPEYNPRKRFGTIDDEGALIYEDVTTSYPAYMPTEHYQKFIMDNMPKKDDG